MGRIGWLTTLLFCLHFSLVASNNRSGLVEFQNGWSDLFKKGKLIYDITSLIDESVKSVNKSEFSSSLSTLEKIFYDGGAAPHYEAGVQIQNMTQLSNLMKGIDKVLFQGENSKSKLIISLNNAINTFKISNINGSTLGSRLSALIFPLDDVPCEANMGLNNASLSVKNFLNSYGISLGFRYQQDRCYPSKLAIEQADFLYHVVNFTTHVGFPESYTIFRNHLLSIAQKKGYQQDWTKFKFHLTLNSFVSEYAVQNDLEYNLLLSQFSKAWTEESGSSVIVKFSKSSFFSKLGKIPAKVIDRNNVIYPWIHIIKSHTSFTPAFLFRALTTISSMFEKIHVRDEGWKEINRILDQLGPETKLPAPVNAALFMWGNNANEISVKETVAVAEKLKKRNIIFHSLELRDFTHKPTWFDGVIGDLPTACGHFYLSSLPPIYAVQKTMQQCGFLFDQNSSSFSFYLEIDWKTAAAESYSFEFYNKDVQQKLNDALMARNEILKVKENADVTVKFVHDNLPQKVPYSGFYCNATLLKINAYFEAMGNWARMNNYPIRIGSIFPDLVNNDKLITWWSRITVTKDISTGLTSNMPVYVLRNFPKNPNPYWSVNSCVQWSKNVPEEGIPLDSQLSGVTVSMDVQEDLSVQELETMLLFSFHKFKTVEIQPKKEDQLADLKTLNDLLNSDFLEALVDFDILGGSLYLEISVEGTNFTETFDQLEDLSERISQGPETGVRLGGIHLTNWGKQIAPEAELKQIVDLGQTYNFKVGLVFPNCAKLLDAIAKPPNSTLIPPTDYILCPTKLMLAYNKNKEDFSTNLDTHLYISKILENFLPGRAIHFRLQSAPCCDTDDWYKQAENFVRFLNDVNQFAVGNQLKYFLTQAFTSASRAANTSSWFHSENHANLNNVSAIIDREGALGNHSNIIGLRNHPYNWVRNRKRNKKNSIAAQKPLTPTESVISPSKELSTLPSKPKVVVSDQPIKTPPTPTPLPSPPKFHNARPSEYEDAFFEIEAPVPEQSFHREEVSPCRTPVPVGFGYSFQNGVGFTQNKILKLGELNPSNIQNIPEGINLSRHNVSRSCYEVFRNPDRLLTAKLRELGIPQSSVAVEGFGKSVSQKHSCFNLLPAHDISTTPTWNSLTAAVDFSLFNVEINPEVTLEPDFIRDLSRLHPSNTMNQDSDNLWDFFFRLYSTHTVTKVELGGSILITVELKPQLENTAEKLGDFETLAILSKAIGEISKSLQWEEKKNCILGPFDIEPRVSYKLSMLGGNPIHYFANFSEMTLVKNVFKWKESLEHYPVVLPTSLKVHAIGDVVEKYGKEVSKEIPGWIRNQMRRSSY